MLVDCDECGKQVDINQSSISKPSSSNSNSNEHIVELWWCRDCISTVCKQCHLLKGHSEHRSNEWKEQEVLRSCVQALEGRCSRRSEYAHQQKMAVKQLVAKIEVILLNELSGYVERRNEPDRRLISRLNRELINIDSRDERPSIYHVPSPSRPAWKTWNLDVSDPTKMQKVLDMTADIMRLPRHSIAESDVPEIKSSTDWDARLMSLFICESIGIVPVQVNDARSDNMSVIEDRRRGCSVDSSVSRFVREGPYVSSFREKSIPLEEAPRLGSVSSSSICTVDTRPSNVSSLPPLSDYNSHAISILSSSITPTPREEDETSSFCFGKSYLTRPICVEAFSTQSKPNKLAVTDSCGGVYITNSRGEIEQNILIKNSSASSVCVDEKNELMYVSVMQSKGRSIHVFDVASNCRKVEVIACPRDPKIEMSRTRWITVGPRGHLFMTSGDNIKSALWTYIRSKKAWKLLKESRKSRYQYLTVAEDQADYKAVVLLTCDAANNRLLLFVIDHSMSLINEYDLSKTYRLNEHIHSPASAIVDKHGNLLILDYASGKLWILLSGVKGVRRLKQVTLPDIVRPQEALGICSRGDVLYLALFNRREILCTQYLEEGVFKSALATSSPIQQRRSTSLPRS
ncbi:hypothetical protein L3Y34_015095 [Caenorhabditis briggsae]|uniref:Uncharacterized protein n=1 Tax=Caenorhabditis briggsae TaxID=6238 RepID=A0AAE9DV00_CAEBR|nr:hypothetical protein L3Y34_015095 [Caenorhabditis briggsae]